MIEIENSITRFQSKTHISPLLTIESSVAQWLEYPVRSRRVVGSIPIWNSDFISEFSGDAIFYFYHLSYTQFGGWLK